MYFLPCLNKDDDDDDDDDDDMLSVLFFLSFSFLPRRSHFFPGGYLTKFCTGRLRPEVQPLTLSYTILAEKVPLLYTFC